MKECITLNTKEQKRLLVLGRVDRGEVGVRDAAVVLSLCVRQVRRLLAGYRREGAARGGPWQPRAASAARVAR